MAETQLKAESSGSAAPPAVVEVPSSNVAVAEPE
ncbi:hypothetical protein L195_g042749, partial [Trifolium pratense]